MPPPYGSGDTAAYMADAATTGAHPDTMYAPAAPAAEQGQAPFAAVMRGVEVDLRRFGLGVYNADAAVAAYDAAVREALSHEVVRAPLEALA